MNKTRFLAALVFLLSATTVFAAQFGAGSPATTNNDDSCDIAVMPAATLLLPHWEVDLASNGNGVTTLFTITNTSRTPQIVRLTFWTDFAYPALTFNLFLTGYDVAPINLYDILVRGAIAPPTGTSPTITPGALSQPNTSNINFAANAATACANPVVAIPPSLRDDLRRVFTSGATGNCPANVRVGGAHTFAMGYMTADVVNTCGINTPLDFRYYRDELLFDNVLTGDYEVIDTRTGASTLAAPMVHLRALPEGGPAGLTTRTNLPYTFYDRFTPRTNERTQDRRQPLPSTFAARWLQGGPGGLTASYAIWREGRTGPNATCADYAGTSTNGVSTGNQLMPIPEIVRFDEHENPTVFAAGVILIPTVPVAITLPATSMTSTSSSTFPAVVSPTGDVGGWMYLNLNNGGSVEYSVTTNGFSSDNGSRDFRTGSSTIIGPRQSQNWVTVSLGANGRFPTTLEATMLGNGCSPAPALSNANVSNGPAIGPAPNTTP